MNIAKSLSSLSLAIAMVGGLVLLAPTSVDAAGKSNKANDKRFGICREGIKSPCNSNFKPVKPPSRPCNRKGFACLH
jgi:hypothetical protein